MTLPDLRGNAERISQERARSNIRPASESGPGGTGVGVSTTVSRPAGVRPPPAAGSSAGGGFFGGFDIGGITEEQSVVGLPDGAEFWNVDGQTYVVWFTPFGDPPIPLAYTVPPDTPLSSLTPLGQGITINRTLTREQFRQAGPLTRGSVLRIPPGARDPWALFLDDYDRERQIRPWLEDPDIMALFAGAVLEQRPISQAELRTTDWWRTHSQEQRDWLVLNASDPATAERVLQDQRHRVQQALRAAGINAPSTAVVHRIADAVTTGEWTADYGSRQIRALSDQHSGIPLDRSLSRDGLDQTQDQEAEVRDLVRLRLGPMLGQWSDELVGWWAGQLRNDPDARDRLDLELGRQLAGHLPNYGGDATLDYETVAGSWRQRWLALTGALPDEVNDGLWFRALQSNDAATFDQVALESGFESGRGSVMDDALGQLRQATGVGVRSPAAVLR